MILIDTHERKTPDAIIQAFGAEMQTLTIADYCDTDRSVLIEFKIKQDVHSYMRLGDEATRMNYPQYAKFFRHAIYVDDLTMHSFEEFRKFVSICVHANVFPHFVVWDRDYLNLVHEIKKISQPSYNKPLQIHQHSKELGQLGQIIATFPGLGKQAGAIELTIDPPTIKLNGACQRVMGTNKDGSARKVVADMLTFLENFKGLI